MIEHYVRPSCTYDIRYLSNFGAIDHSSMPMYEYLNYPILPELSEHQIWCINFCILLSHACLYPDVHLCVICVNITEAIAHISAEWYTASIFWCCLSRSRRPQRMGMTVHKCWFIFIHSPLHCVWSPLHVYKHKSTFGASWMNKLFSIHLYILLVCVGHRAHVISACTRIWHGS